MIGMLAMTALGFAAASDETWHARHERAKAQVFRIPLPFDPDGYLVVMWHASAFTLDGARERARRPYRDYDPDWVDAGELDFYVTTVSPNYYQMLEKAHLDASEGHQVDALIELISGHQFMEMLGEVSPREQDENDLPLSVAMPVYDEEPWSDKTYGLQWVKRGRTMVRTPTLTTDTLYHLRKKLIDRAMSV